MVCPMNNSGRGFEVPMVQVIIVTWNKQKDVTRLLEQLRHINYPEGRFEITVVDNNSTDNTIQAIEGCFPRVRLIRNADNLGGAGGFNTGIRWVLENRPESKYMWLLDNDVLVDRDALEELVAVMECSPEAAMCGSKVMNIAKPSEIIEAGAFLDFVSGKTRSNRPQNNLDSVYRVDYVAACSLLVRTESVKELGMLNEKLFIYWDDMEWGARFNASGYEVLASTASVVYHPSWAERTGDNSAIWRRYYRTRNQLWFFNNYTSGIERRVLLLRIVTSSLISALSRCMCCDSMVSRSIVWGIKDFFQNIYGKRDIQIPVYNIDDYLSTRTVKAVCVFIRQVKQPEKAEDFVRALKERFPRARIVSIIPHELWHVWATLSGENDVMPYRDLKNRPISWPDKFRILKFLWKKPWDLLVTSPLSNWTVGMWGKDVPRIDFDEKVAISIERMRLTDCFRIAFTAMSFLIRGLLFPPATERLGLSSDGP